MKKSIQLMGVLLLLVISTLFTTELKAQAVGDLGAVTNGDWAQASTWKAWVAGSPGSFSGTSSVPTSGKNVWIPSGITVTDTVTLATQSCKDLNVTGTLTFGNGPTSTNSCNFQCSGNINVTSTGVINSTTLSGLNASTIFMMLASSQTITIDGTFGDATSTHLISLSPRTSSNSTTISGSSASNIYFYQIKPNSGVTGSTVTFNANVTITKSSAGLAYNSSSAAGNDNTTYTVSAGKTLTTSGSVCIGASSSTSPGASGTGLALNVYGTLITGSNLNLKTEASSSKTFTLTVGDGTNTALLQIGGHFSNNLSSGASSTGLTVNVVNKGTVSFTGSSDSSYLVGATTTINGTWNFANTLTGARSFSTTTTSTIGSTGVVRFPDATYATGTLTLSAGSTIQYDGTGYTLPAAPAAYQNLTINSTGTLTNPSGITVNGNLTLLAGTFSNTTNNITIANGGGIIRTAGVLSAVPAITSGSYAVTYNGSADIASAATSTLELNPSGGGSVGTITVNLSDNTKTVNTGTGTAVTSAGGVTITSGTLALGNNLSLTGNWSRANSGTGFTPGTKTVTFNGTTQSLTITGAGGGTETFYALTTSGSTVVTVGSSTTLSVSNTLTLTGGTLDMSTNQLTGAFSPAGTSGTLKTSNTGSTPIPSLTWAAGTTVNYAGASQTILNCNYANLSLTGASGTPNFGSGTIGISGTFTPGSITTASSGTINFNNASGNQIIPAFNYNNLTNSSTSANLNSLAASGTIGVAGTYTIAGSKALTGVNSITYGSGATLSMAGSGSATLSITSPEWPPLNGPTNVNLGANILNFPSLTVSNYALTSNVATLTTSAAHGFSVGQTVVIANVAPSSVFNGTFTITGVPSSTTFTFAKTNADITSAAASAGNANTTNIATITNVALTSNVATITTAANHGFVTGQSVTLANVSVSGSVFNGTYTLASASGTTFTFAKTNANISSVAATGLCSASSLPVLIGGAALTSNVATITTATAHGYSVGQNVIVANVSSNGSVYNGTYTIAAVSSNTFSYARTNADITSSVVSGYAYVPTVTSIARSVPGTITTNGGTLTLGVANIVVFSNGSTINRNSVSSSSKFNSGGGTYYFGSSSSDVVNINITASCTASSDMPSSTASVGGGKIALSIADGITFSMAGNSTNAVKSVNFNTSGKIDGTVAASGNANNFDLTVLGDVTGSGTYTHGILTLSTPVAGGSNNLSGINMDSLIVNNSNGVTLTGNAIIAKTLTFTSGKITTSSFALTDSGIVSGAGTGWVIGNFIKNITSAATYTFEVGDATNYTPASLVIPATGLTAGLLQVSTASPLSGYANVSSLKLNRTTNYLNRYWTVAAPGGSTFGGTYTGTFTYVAGDLTGSRTNFRTGIYNSGWTYGAATAGTLTLATPALMSTGSTFVFADPIPLTITANNNSKTYGTAITLNGSTGFTPTGLTGSDAISSVTLTCTGQVATAAATTYTITPSAASGSAVTSGNYAISYSTGTLTVNPASLTLTASAQSKTYGATTLSTSGVLNTTYTVSGIQNSDAISVSLDYAGGDAASASATTYTITPSAPSATNYTITPVTGTLTVNKAALSITANNRTKIAGNTLVLGTTAFSTSTLSNSDAVTSVTLTSAGATSGAAANTYAITPSAAIGTGLSNYDITYNDGTLTVSNLTAQSISFTPFTTPVTYGSSTFNLSATATSGLSLSFASSNTSVATVSGNTVTIVGAGSTNITASQAGDGTTYAPAPDSTLQLVVSQANLTITGLTGTNKVYDRSTSASFTGTATYSGLQNGENFSVSGTPSASFANASVANGKTITITGYTAPNANYTVTQPSVTANITALGLTISGITANNKVADGTNTATLSGSGSLVGVLSGDIGSVTLNGSSASATFADANVGTGKAVTVIGYALTGSASGNYSVSQPSGLTANITYPATYYFTTASADITDVNNWWSNAAGTGVHPTDFTTAAVTYNVYASTTTTAAWSVSGASSKIVVGNGSTSVTLTIASGFAISNATAAMDVSANSIVILQDATTQPTFGTLNASSEVHYQATISTLTTSFTYGKLYFDGSGKTVTVSGNPVVNTSLTVGTGSTLSFGSGSTNYMIMNTGATATINGTIKITKQLGFVSFSVATPSSSFATLQFKSAEVAGTTLVLNSGCTVEYSRTNASSSQTIAARTDYKNLTIADGSSAIPKTISGAITVTGTLTVNQAFSGSTLTAGGTITLNGNLALTAGSLDMSTYQLTGTIASSVTGTSGTLKTSNTSSTPIPTGLTFATGTTVNYAGTNQSIVVNNYYNLDLTSASNITFPSGIVGISGAFTPASITSATQGTIDFNLAVGGQTIPAFGYYNLKSTNTATGTANTTASTGTINIANSFTQAGKYALNNGGVSFTYASGATYIFNGTSSMVLTTTNPAWPATNGPTNVTVNGQTTSTLSFTPAATSYSISNVALTSNVATVTTSTSHSLNVGDQITIGALASNGTYMFNGTFTITGVTSNTVSFTLVRADVPSTANGSSAAKLALSNISRTIAGNFTISANSFTIGAGNSLILANGSTTIIGSSTSTFSYSGGYIGLGTSSTDLVNVKIDIGSSNTIAQGGELNGVPAPGAYGTLTISSGTYQPTSSRVVNSLVNNGVLSLSATTSTGSFTIGNTAISGSGSITGSGTITGSAVGASLIINGNNVSANSISFTGGSATFGTFTMNRTGSSGALTVNSPITVSTSLTLTAGTLNDGGNVITVNGNIAGSGTHTGTGKILLAGSYKTISSATFNNVEINNAASDTLVGNPIVNGVLTLTNGELVVGSHTLTLSGGAISVGSGTLTTSATSNISFTGTNAGPLNIPSSVDSLATLTINNTNATPATINVNGGLALTTLALTSGTLNDNGNIISLTGGITGTGTATGSGKISMIGSSSQSMTGVTLNNLEINNAAGCTLSGTGTVLTINGVLSFVQGKLTTNSTTRTVNIASGASISGAGTGTGWVVGYIQKYIAAPGVVTYEIGDAANYTPASIDISSTGFTNGTIKISTTASTITQGGTLSLTSAIYKLNRYWNVVLPATSTFAGTYQGTFDYVATDLTGAASGLQTAVYNGTGWSYPGAPSLGTLQLTTPAGISPSFTTNNVVFAGQSTLSIGGITATDKEYDKNTSATLDFSAAAFVGLKNSNIVTFDYSGALGTFDDVNAGTAKTGTVTGVTISGADVNAYTLTPTQVFTGNITKKPLTVTASTNNKAYDGNTSTTSTPTITAGVVLSGDVANFTQAYITASVGTGKTITPSGTVTDGNNGDNYSYDFVSDNTGIIFTSGYTWAGTVSTDWSNVLNWSGGSVPTSSSDVTILASSSRFPALTSNASVHNLLNESGAYITLNGKTLSINGVITGAGTFIGSSASGLTMSSSSANTLNFSTSASSDTLLGSLTLNGAGTVSLGTGLGITSLLSLSNASAVLNLNSHHLTLKSTSIANTAEVGAVTSGASITGGNVTVERFIPQGLRTYRDLCASVANAGPIFYNWQEGGVQDNFNHNGIFITGKIGAGVDATTGLDMTPTGYSSMYSFASSAWSAVTNTKTTNLDPFQGVRALVRGARNYNIATANTGSTMPSPTTLRTTGTLITGDVTYYVAGGTGANQGTKAPDVSVVSSYGLTSGADAYSLIANPYACPIDWSKVTKTNVTNSYYYLDPTFLQGGYSTYVTVLNNGVTNLGLDANKLNIQAGQGFFVQNEGSGTPQLVIHESDKVVGGTHTSVFGTSTLNLLAIKLIKNIGGTDAVIDGTVAMFDNNFSKNVTNEDAKKLANGGENISITEGSIDVSIDGIPMPTATDVIALKLGQVTANTAYQLKVDATNFVGAGVLAYIKDNFLNTEVPVSTTVTFTPTTNAATYQNRFSIVFKSTTALSVRFTTVKAAQSEHNISVNWATANESNLASYEVEKSVNGKDFSKVNTQVAKNVETASYNWLDQQAVSGSNYYRIKVIENDGKTSYSNVVVVNMDKNVMESISVYPNPVTDKVFTLQMLNITKGKYNVSLINNLGQEVMTSTINHEAGSSSETIRMNSVLPSGIYTMVVKSTEGKSVYQSELLAK